jgi:photosystem II PsbY protein
MRESKGIVVGLGIGGGLAASGLLTPPPEAYAAAEAFSCVGQNPRRRSVISLLIT